MQADTLLSTLFAQELEQMPTAITPGRTRSASLSASSTNLAALPEGQPMPGVAAAAVTQQQQEQQPAQQQRPGTPENGRQQAGAAALPPAAGSSPAMLPPLPPPPRNGGGQQQAADGLPFKVPPKFLFTCTVGRSMASKARCGGCVRDGVATAGYATLGGTGEVWELNCAASPSLLLIAPGLASACCPWAPANCLLPPTHAARLPPALPVLQLLP